MLILLLQLTMTWRLSNLSGSNSLNFDIDAVTDWKPTQIISENKSTKN